jgi:hypothetical protein
MLTDLERKVKGKWVSFKKELRANKSLDPDYAEEKFRAEKAKYDVALKSIEKEREKVVVKSLSSSRTNIR